MTEKTKAESNSPNEGDEPVSEAGPQGDLNRIRRHRMSLWISLSTIPLIVALFVLVSRFAFGIDPSPNALAAILISLFIVRVVVTTVSTIREERSFAETVLAEKKPIDPFGLRRFLSKNLDAFWMSDMVFAPLLIFSLGLSLDLINGAWLSAAIWGGWFAGVSLLLPLQKMTKRLGGEWETLASKIGWLWALFFLPVMLNAFWSSNLTTDDLLSGTGIRLVFTVMSMLAVIFLSIFLMTALEFNLFRWLMRLLPARRNLGVRPAHDRNIIALKEVLIFKELNCGAAASIALGAIIFWLFDVYPSHWVFLLYNALTIVPPIIAVIVFARALPRESQRYLRRLSLQSAAITLIILNLFLVLGYVIGYLLTQSYKWLFADFGSYPYPDRFFFFRDIAPNQLPLGTQLEALLATMIVLFALSWVVYVLQARARKEALYIGCLTGAAAGLPYLNIDFIEILAQYFPNLTELPHWFFAISIPAFKGLITTDVKKIVFEEGSTGGAVRRKRTGLRNSRASRC